MTVWDSQLLDTLLHREFISMYLEENPPFWERRIKIHPWGGGWSSVWPLPWPLLCQSPLGTFQNLLGSVFPLLAYSFLSSDVRHLFPPLILVTVGLYLF